MNHRIFITIIFTLIVTIAFAQSTIVPPTIAPACSLTVKLTLSTAAGTTLSEPISCKGVADRKAVATATKGTPPYTYSWNGLKATAKDTISNLGVGTHSVIVTDAKGCKTKASIELKEASDMVIAITPVADKGQNSGSATANVAGGAGGYSYKWDVDSTTATITNLETGPYKITITDAVACTATATVKVPKESPKKTKTAYFYKKDVLFGGKAYILACQRDKEKELFEFHLIKGDKINTFSLVEIAPTEVSIDVFQQKLKKAISDHGETHSPAEIKQIDIAAAAYLAKIHFQSIIINDTAAEVGRVKALDSVIMHRYYGFPKKKKLYQKWEDIMEKIDLASSLKKDRRVSKLNFKLTRLDGRIEIKEIKKLADDTQKVCPEYGPNCDTSCESLCNEKLDAYYISKPIEIIQVEIEFEAEQITNIKVITSDNGRRILFQNLTPIAYSTKSNITNNDKKYKLFEEQGNSRFIYLEDVFWNNYQLLNYTENYSPKDQVVKLRPGEEATAIYKEKVTNILSARIYSDFVGLNSSSPNGLIQTEISRSFYFNTQTRDIFTKRLQSSYLGFVNSTTPKFTLSKVEDNNKYLLLDHKQLPNNYVRYNARVIDVFRHTSWTSGGKANIIYFGFPFVQSKFFLNVGGFVRHTPMQIPALDSSLQVLNFKEQNVDEERKFGLNTVSLFSELEVQINPHSQFQISYALRFNRLFKFTRDFDMVSDVKAYENHAPLLKPWVVSVKFEASAKINEDKDGEFFFRSYFNFVPKMASQNYFQAQIGYAFNIFSKPKTKEPDALIPIAESYTKDLLLKE